ncbi:unnamed protein product [Durusdinium trenchii]|uniref:Uncharacterized protein n=1 Tax=Durusdinium trenchii TaxID=1381693 RepID=A0ABP0KF44_9DINO
MRWLWALAALCYAAAKEAEQPRPLNEPAALLESDVKTATGSQVHGDESSPPSTTEMSEEKQIKKWEEEKAQIAREVEERIKEHADKKQEEEEESEKAESDATFLIFAVLGLAAVARWLCKGQFQREHSGYIIITDTSPTKKRHTSDPAKAWAQKRTHSSLDSVERGNGAGASGVPSSPQRPGPKSSPEGKGALSSLLSAKK